ncbi:MAG: serine O-acetyltransferase [Solirubrobacteraceae bacterium]
MDAVRIQKLAHAARGLPLAVILRRCSVGDAVRRDAARAIYTKGRLDPSGSDRDLRRLLSQAEFRSVVYERLLHHGTPAEAIAGLLLAAWWPGQCGLEFACPSIGPGLVINHGFGSVLMARSIGADCFISHGVTLGLSNKGGPPVIGDRVTLHVGAVVIGPVTVGDGAIVGANSLVLGDVPPGAVVVGSPARVVGRAPVDPWR